MNDAGGRTKPLVSIVVPVYRAEPFLAACLDSLLGQSLGEIEVIAVNDASPDGSQRIIEDRAARDPRLRFRVNPINEAALESRILGAEMALGGYIAFCDADDRLPETAIERLHETARRTGADIVHGRARGLNGDGPGKRLRLYDPFSVDTGQAFVKNFLGTVRGWNLWGKLYAADAWRRAAASLPRGKKWTLAEDLLASFVVGLNAERYAGLNETVYWYRQPAANYFDSPGDVERRVADHVEVLALMRAMCADDDHGSAVSRRLDFLTGHIIASMFRYLPPDGPLRTRAEELVSGGLGTVFPPSGGGSRETGGIARLTRRAFSFLREYGLGETIIALRRGLTAARRKGWRKILAALSS